MLLSELAIYILPGNAEIFRPESDDRPTVYSALRVMMSQFSLGFLEVALMLNKVLKYESCVDILLLWTTTHKQSWSVFGMHLIFLLPTQY